MLGSILVGSTYGGIDAMGQVAELLTGDDFYTERHRLLYKAMSAIYSRGEPIDYVTVSAELDKADQLERLGGMRWLAELSGAAMDVPVPLEPYARIIAERARLRRLIDLGGQITYLGYEPGEHTVDEVCDEAGRLLLDMLVQTDSGGLRLAGKDLFATFEDMDRRCRAGGGITGVPTGFADLDEMTGGLQKGDMIVLAARPSTGKTACGTGMAIHAALEAGVPAGIFSLEMSRQQINYRMLAHEARVDLSRMLRGRLHDDDFGRLAHAAGCLKAAPIYIDDTAALTVMQLRARARRLKLEQPDLGLLIVDYLQIMNGGGENRTQQITGISQGIKAIAKELDLPVLVLSQLNREPDKRVEHRPKLSDLRESGAIEQDADVVLFLYRPGMYDAAEGQGKTELIIAKQRNGPLDTVNLWFEGRFACFENALGGWGNR